MPLTTRCRQTIAFTALLLKFQGEVDLVIYNTKQYRLHFDEVKFPFLLNTFPEQAGSAVYQEIRVYGSILSVIKRVKIYLSLDRQKQSLPI